MNTQAADEKVYDTFSDVGFTCVKGGQHADGVTANVLITLTDGVYLELV